MPKSALIAMAALISSQTLHAEDWPQWRGPKRDGAWRETGIIESFPSQGLKIRWRIAIGYGYSSPVVAQGLVFVTDSQLMNPKSTERVLCLDEATGAQRWHLDYDPSYPDWAFTPGNEGCPTATPVIANGIVYALGRNGHLHALRAEKGQLVWKKQLRAEYHVLEFACQPSPLVEGNLLIVFVGGSPGASVIAFNKDSGEEVWKALDESVTNSSPIVIEHAGKRQLIVWTEESVTALELQKGTTIWRHVLKTSRAGAVSTPVFRDGHLLIAGLMLRLDAEMSQPRVLWPQTNAVDQRVFSNTSTAMIENDCVYSAKSNGEFICLDAATGEEIWFTDKITAPKSGASVHITPNGHSALLYTDEGDLVRASLTRDGYRELARTHLVDPTFPFGGHKMAWPPPAYANGHIIARTDKEIVCASLRE